MTLTEVQVLTDKLIGLFANNYSKQQTTNESTLTSMIEYGTIAATTMIKEDEFISLR
jgi:hypothetical protein